MKDLRKIFSKQPYLIIMYRALFMTTYIGLFRIGEVTQSQHILKARDVHIARNKHKLLFILCSSKTHTLANSPQTIKISSEAIPHTTKSILCSCPYETLRSYLAVRQGFTNVTEQFFVFTDGAPVTLSHMRETLKKCLQFGNFDLTVYLVHGLRGGCAVDLLNIGLLVETIKKIGRWKSNAVFSYLKHT